MPRNTIAPDNPYRPLLFRRGYLASTHGPLPRPDGWQSWHVEGFWLGYDPLTPFDACHEHGRFVAVLGHVVSLDHDSVDHAVLTRVLFDAFAVSDDALHRALDACCGRFVCVYSDGTRTCIVGDASGMKMIHYTTTPQVAVASHARLLADAFEKPSSRAVADYLAAAAPSTCNMAFLPGHATRHDGVRILPPNNALDLADGRLHRVFPREPLASLPDEAAIAQASAHLADIARKFARVMPLAISLTAGLDSRLTLAAAHDIRDAVQCFTYVREGNPTNTVDAIIATRLAQAHALDHVLLHFDHATAASGADTGDFAQFKAVADHAGDFEHFHPLAHAYLRTFPRERLHLRSNIGEICRARYYTKPFETIVRGNEADAVKLARIHDLWTRAAAHPFAVAEFKRYLIETGLPDAARGFDLPALYYWEHLMPVWHGALLLESDLSHDTVSLFNCRRVLTTFLAMDFATQVSRAGMLGCIGQLWPALLDEPINPKLAALTSGAGDAKPVAARPPATSQHSPAPLQIDVVRDASTVTARIAPDTDAPSDAEFAFYLLAGQTRLATRWYTRDSTVVFDIPAEARNAALSVRGFVRAASDHTDKRSRLVTVPSQPEATVRTGPPADDYRIANKT